MLSLLTWSIVARAPTGFDASAQAGHTATRPTNTNPTSLRGTRTFCIRCRTRTGYRITKVGRGRRRSRLSSGGAVVDHSSLSS